MKVYRLAILIVIAFLFTACGGDEEDVNSATLSAADRGFHFQGRDCLACHNIDLGVSKNLVVAGTLYKSSNVQDMSNLAETCNADLAIEFLDSGLNVVYSSANYYDGSSKGYRGQGNVFLLDRLFNSTLNGTYTMRIVERVSGLSIAQSSSGSHSFSSAPYSISTAVDLGNRISCNTCHNGGITNPLYVQSNSNLCK
ncbi:hypothetical protein JHD47_07845 [Sulfurimonas sp. SAG-AH-194-L11]|nr:hypothetical protein [Sulfurimonas sp. SAG-AH-194-L11]MDF1877726.1 hypothetical protein [Sulfurimonas sp. SAG-AH-194-L11]